MKISRRIALDESFCFASNQSFPNRTHTLSCSPLTSSASTPTSSWISAALEQWSPIADEKVVILGDFNAPRYNLNDVSDGKTRTLNNFLSYFNATQYNNVLNSHQRLLDLVISNVECEVESDDNPLVLIDAYHPALKIQLKRFALIQNNLEPSKQQRVYNFKKCDFTILYRALTDTDWLFLLRLHHLRSGAHHGLLLDRVLIHYGRLTCDMQEQPAAHSGMLPADIYGPSEFAGVSQSGIVASASNDRCDERLSSGHSSCFSKKAKPITHNDDGRSPVHDLQEAFNDSEMLRLSEKSEYSQ
nr:unnamed protein product [Callosobruchus chinensis]